MRRRPAFGLAALLLCVLATPVQAHLLNMTRVQVDVGADDQVAVSASLDLTREAGGGAEYYRLSRSPSPLTDSGLQPRLSALAVALQLRLDGALIPLRVTGVRLPQLPESDFLSPVAWPMTDITLVGTLPPGAALGSGSLQMRFDPAFRFEEPIALTLQLGSSGRRMTRWLVAGQLSPSLPLRAPTSGEAAESAAGSEPVLSGLWRYLVFGFEHILPRGLDHMLFVIGLYLGTRRLRTLLMLVTSFTVAHSATLILASFGALRLPASVVEPLITLSIVWIGLENLLSERVRAWRVALVFAFGLLHGLGFAAALKELGLPQSNFLATLLSFNLGVEFGQLAVIGLALLLTGWSRQHSGYRRYFVIPGSLTIAMLALVWTVLRLRSAG
ncbi:MAG: HupE/UreJ family protein [Hydrocarboniphaga sp.]|uniref:HupE/UreJ family protein n=1 Tax=Hydrocarboniphaga sp. TaxID=2033016 RepID=UPI0026390228|nr:HupE/UreJ family protein [Hydrocarboniphaga sp.]MDB5971711.1 HupE/UreJ family protein [Hydrocarboniphaga sp.]